MSWFYILVLLVSLIIIQNVYFKIAGIIKLADLPNPRSSHSKPTIRGGGIVIPLGILGYSILNGIEYPYFITGLILIAILSFLDDLKHLPPLVRIIGQTTAIGLLFFEVAGNGSLSIPLLMLYVVAVGTLNAYNFMDGINGMMAGYSLVLLSTLLFIDLDVVSFIDENLILSTLVGVVVFTFYNFRKKAVCFSGDVGSVGMAFLGVFFIGLLISVTGSFIWILLLAVYGVDSVLTIVHRLTKRNNIFSPHRTHLYQYFANIDNVPHLFISTVYGVIQLLVNVLILLNFHYHWINEYYLSIFILGVLGCFYIVYKIRFETKKNLLKVNRTLN